MKKWKTTDVGPSTVARGVSPEVSKAAADFRRDRNGGLPPNLHLSSRIVLLNLIKELYEENKKLREAQP